MDNVVEGFVCKEKGTLEIGWMGLPSGLLDLWSDPGVMGLGKVPGLGFVDGGGVAGALKIVSTARFREVGSLLSESLEMVCVTVPAPEGVLGSPDLLNRSFVDLEMGELAASFIDLWRSCWIISSFRFNSKACSCWSWEMVALCFSSRLNISCFALSISISSSWIVRCKSLIVLSDVTLSGNSCSLSELCRPDVFPYTTHNNLQSISYDEHCSHRLQIRWWYITRGISNLEIQAACMRIRATRQFPSFGEKRGTNFCLQTIFCINQLRKILAIFQKHQGEYIQFFNLFKKWIGHNLKIWAYLYTSISGWPQKLLR